MARTKSGPPLDLVKEHAEEYATPPTPVMLRVAPARYLSITGESRPGDRDFQTKLRALYAVAYTLKFEQRAKGREYKVPMIEGLYEGFTPTTRSIVRPRRLNWKLMIRTPDFITAGDVRAAASKAVARREEPTISEVRLTREREGTCVQMLHVGPYRTEASTIGAMTEFARSRGLSALGTHHEIYLSDPRRVPPSKLRTILRVPVRRKR